MKHPARALLACCLIALVAPLHAQKTAGNVVDDSTVNASVKAALFDHKDTPSGQINVETYRGVVLLSGFVATEAQKIAAGQVAAGVSGVKDVHNAIALQPNTSFGTKLEDAGTTSRVKAALMDDKDVKSGQINVETKSGVVQLGGFVASELIRRRALEVAAGVSGVKRVEDAMYVRPE